MNAHPNTVVKERMKKVNNIATKVFGGINPLANITEAQVEQLPQYRKNQNGDYEEVMDEDGGNSYPDDPRSVNVSGLKGMYAGQFTEESDYNQELQETQGQQPRRAPQNTQRRQPPSANRQQQQPPPNNRFKALSKEQIHNLELSRKQDFCTAASMAPMASPGGLIDLNEVDMGDNAMYGGMDNGMGGNMSYEEDYLPDFSSLRADPSEFTDPV
jgi:hypothetical protein